MTTTTIPEIQFNYMLIPAMVKTNEEILFEKIKTIEKIVCDYYFLLPDILKTKTRSQKIVKTRYVIYYFCIKYAKTTLSGIGNRYCQDHATVLYGTRYVSDKIEILSGHKCANAELKKDIEYLEQLIKEKL